MNPIGRSAAEQHPVWGRQGVGGMPGCFGMMLQGSGTLGSFPLLGDAIPCVHLSGSLAGGTWEL